MYVFVLFCRVNRQVGDAAAAMAGEFVARDIVHGQIVCDIDMPRRAQLRSSPDLQSQGLVSAAQGEFSFGNTAAHSASRGASMRDFARPYAVLVRSRLFRTVPEGRFGLESHMGTVV